MHQKVVPFTGQIRNRKHCSDWIILLKRKEERIHENGHALSYVTQPGGQRRPVLTCSISFNLPNKLMTSGSSPLQQRGNWSLEGEEFVQDHKLDTLWGWRGGIQPRWHPNTLKKNLLTYYWIYGVFIAAWGLSLVAWAGSLRWVLGFSLQWLLFLRSTGLGACGLASCGTWASLLRGTWDLPRPDIEPMFPALAAGFLSTVPPGKSETP